MPPPYGTYLIQNAQTKTYLGLAGDNKTLVMYNIPEQARVWVLYKHLTNNTQYLATVLPDGTFTYLAYYTYTETAQPPSTNADLNFVDYGANTYAIRYHHNQTCYYTYSGTGGGSISSNVVGDQGNASRWVFIPFTTAAAFTSAFLSNYSVVELFSLSDERLRQITAKMLESFKKNLTQTRPQFMIPTYVTKIPTGSETGTYLSLTVADTFIRVSSVEFNGDTTYQLTQKRFNFPPGLTNSTSNAEKFFGFMADGVTKAIEEWGLTATEPIGLGFSFPFPVDKMAINEAKLLRWTKGFSVKDVEGKDVVKLLQRALDEKQVCVTVKALLNDTTATLLARAYEAGSCDIGAIIGSGTNGAYIENVDNVRLLSGLSGQMVMNTEWGGFDDSILAPTRFDNHVNRESVHPGQYIFEKLSSSTRIGEIARLVLLDSVDMADLTVGATGLRPLFNRASSTKLNTPGSIDFALLREIEASKDLSALSALLAKQLGIPVSAITEGDAKLVKDVCRAVALRSARLNACAIAASLMLMGKAALGGGVDTGGQVGIEGNLVQSYPQYLQDMRFALRPLIGEAAEKKVSFGIVRNGSDVGAALSACHISGA